MEIGLIKFGEPGGVLLRSLDQEAFLSLRPIPLFRRLADGHLAFLIDKHPRLGKGYGLFENALPPAFRQITCLPRPFVALEPL